MARQEQSEENQRPGGAESRPTPADVRARAERAAAERAASAKQPSGGEDWADEAARARSASDPRRVTPHDPAGVPSTGDNR